MIQQIILDLSPAFRESIWKHLIPGSNAKEEAAFLFARWVEKGAQGTFECIKWSPVPENGFVGHSEYFLELTDETRAAAIKEAHDLEASLVELHSHTGPWPAQFSGSDLAGFQEFVPHVWWRLKGRPYLAIVVSRSDFDGLAWITNPRAPQGIAGILSGRTLIKPTGLTLLNGSSDGY